MMPVLIRNWNLISVPSDQKQWPMRSVVESSIIAFIKFRTNQTAPLKVLLHYLKWMNLITLVIPDNSFYKTQQSAERNRDAESDN